MIGGQTALRISAFIELLETYKAKFGDVPVVIRPNDAQVYDVGGLESYPKYWNSMTDCVLVTEDAANDWLT